MKTTLEKEGLISPGDRDLFIVTDEPRVAVDHILEYMRQIGPPKVTPRGLG
jgi:predicted Rossmann-fold nucleotide-binding protein